MTRINVVPENTLTVKHLAGEYHEISRVFRLVLNSLQRTSPVVIPDQYTLGEGHVKFFYNKLGYISERYIRLALEMSYRAWSTGRVTTVNMDNVLGIVQEARDTIPPEWWGEYTPTPEAILINIARIKDRM